MNSSSRHRLEKTDVLAELFDTVSRCQLTQTLINYPSDAHDTVKWMQASHQVPGLKCFTSKNRRTGLTRLTRSGRHRMNIRRLRWRVRQRGGQPRERWLRHFVQVRGARGPSCSRQIPCWIFFIRGLELRLNVIVYSGYVSKSLQNTGPIHYGIILRGITKCKPSRQPA